MSHQEDPPSQISSSTSSGSDQGLTMARDQASVENIPERRTQSLAPELDGGKPPGRPVLRLAMLNAQERTRVQERARSEQPATAPVHNSTPVELPESGYFAARGPLSRSNTSGPSSPFSNPFAAADDEGERPA
ncbi:hypothetical protein IWW55_004596, partial [Coemansia sp. RSA 2706]